MTNEDRIMEIFYKLYEKYKQNKFTIDKTGVKTIALIDFKLSKLSPFQPFLKFNGRETPKAYVEKESKWYNSCSLNIKGYVDDVKIWNQVCDKDGFINSNYGWCIYSKENYKQYDHVLRDLKNNKDSRRATMIYTRPSMWLEYNMDGMSDFMCTWGVHVLINDDNEMIYIVNQRSADIITGVMNDFAWHCEVYKKLYSDLVITYPNLQIGYITFNFGSVHIYERHFDMLKKIVGAE